MNCARWIARLSTLATPASSDVRTLVLLLPFFAPKEVPDMFTNVGMRISFVAIILAAARLSAGEINVFGAVDYSEALWCSVAGSLHLDLLRNGAYIRSWSWQFSVRCDQSPVKTQQSITPMLEWGCRQHDGRHDSSLGFFLLAFELVRVFLGWIEC